MAQFYDISFDFSVNAKGDISLVEDNDAIIQSIKNIIISPKGSKEGSGDINPLFGVGIKYYMFAPLTMFSARSLAGNIYRQLVMFEPRISITNVDVVVNKTDLAFEVYIEYIIIKTDEKFNFRTVINQL